VEKKYVSNRRDVMCASEVEKNKPIFTETVSLPFKPPAPNAFDMDDVY
jgi:hypothetical protein